MPIVFRKVLPPSSLPPRSLAGLAFLGLLCPPVQAADLGRMQTSGVFRLAFSTSQPPLISQEGSDFSGFATELLGRLATQMKVGSVRWQHVTTPPLLVQGLASGNYDAIVDTRLPTPLGDVNLSKPLACGGGVILARPGGATVENDLKGKRVAVVTGSSYFFYVRNLPFAKQIRAYADDGQALLGFLSGAVDVLVTDRYAALKMYKQAGASKIQVGPLLWSQDIDVVVSKSDNKEVLAAIDAALKKMQADGSYAALSNKYFGQDVRCVL